MKIAKSKLGQRIFNASMAFCLVLSTVTTAMPFASSQVAHAVGSVVISNVSELRDAIENQADGQTWTIEPGTYGLSPFNTITAGGQTGWYFPITADDLTINGVGNPTIYGTGFTPNGSWATQDLVAVFGDNVTIDGFNFMPKVQPNKTIEVLGDDFTLRNTVIAPNTLTDPAEYNSISSDYKEWGGSLYFNHEGNHTIENVTVKNAGISYRYSPSGTNIAFSNVKLDYSTNLDWINTYRYSSAFNNAGNTTTGQIGVVYHVSAALNNLDSVLAAVKDGDIIEIDSDLSVTEQLTLTKSVTINGNGHTVTGNFTKTSNSNNSVVAVFADNTVVNDLTVDAVSSTQQLHGINVYEAQDVVLNDITAKNGRTGVNINGSAATINGVTTSGNVWHGVNIDKPGSVLTIGGVSHHSDVIPVYIDSTSVGQVVDTNNQYGSKDNVLKAGDRVYSLKPAVPTLLAPTDNGYTTTNDFYFDWTDVSGAASYEFQNSLSSATNGSGSLTTVHYSATSATSTLHSTGAPDGTVRYWQVRAVDANGIKSDWSTVWKMTIDSTLPTTPVINTPSNNQYFTSTPIVNNWSTSSDTSGINKYQVEYIYDDGHTFSGGPYREVGGSTTSRNHTPATSEQGGVTIRVRAMDNAGNFSAWSAPVHYYYDTIAPAAPILVGPSNNVVTKGASITQSWSVTSSDIDHYVYESYNDAGATSLRWHDTYSSNSKTATNVSDAVYWWGVKAVDHAGNESSWSPLWKITVDNTAPVVTITSPTVVLTNGNVEVRASVSDANLRHYWFQIKKDDVVIKSQTVLSGGITNELLQTLTEDGVYTITVAARDLAGGTADSGNRSADVVKTVTIDKTAPDAPVATYNGSGTQNVTLSTGDSTDEIYYTIDGSTETLYTGPFALTQGLGFSSVARDAAGNESVPLVASAPVITNESSITPTTNSLVLQWNTDEATTSRVVYDTVSHGTLGADANFGYAFSTTEDSNKVTSHSVLVTGLTAGTTYYFRTVSHGSPVAVSDEVNGTTSKIVPAGSNSNGVPVFQVTSNSGADATEDSIVAVTNNDGEVLAAQDSKENLAAAGTVKTDAGFPWYWILALIAAIAAAWWFIAAWRRRQNEA